MQKYPHKSQYTSHDVYPLNGLFSSNSRINGARIRRSNVRLDFKRTFKTANLLFLYYIGICALNNINSFFCFPHRVLVSTTGHGDNCHIELRNFGFRPTGVAGAMELGASIISQGGWDYNKDVITVQRVSK